MMLPILAQIFWTGFANAAYYVLFTIAFALIVKVVQLWNFAQVGHSRKLMTVYIV
jgi:branched-subunit amino acid ABC-type transport system permease component